MTITRRRYWILPDFQSRMIRQWIMLVLLTNVGTNLVTLGFVKYQDRRMQGEYFYVPDKVEGSSVIVDPVVVKRQDIVLPSLLIALGIGFGISLLAGVFYSHRLAGPLYRIRKTLNEAEDGKSVPPIMLRKNDELQGLAEDLNRLLASRGVIS